MEMVKRMLLQQLSIKVDVRDFQDLLPFMTSRAPLLEINGSSVRISIIYRSTFPSWVMLG